LRRISLDIGTERLFSSGILDEILGLTFSSLNVLAIKLASPSIKEFLALSLSNVWGLAGMI
jgi:hypothetical protein